LRGEKKKQKRKEGRGKRKRIGCVSPSLTTDYVHLAFVVVAPGRRGRKKKGEKKRRERGGDRALETAGLRTLLACVCA